MYVNGLALERALETIPLSEVDADAKGLRTVCLSPWGKVESRNGNYVIDDEAAREIVAAFSEHGVAVPVDVEHETVKPPAAGSRGAVGWVEKVYAEKGRGIFGLVKWSDAGRELIRSESFRYLSPVFMVQPEDRRAMRLHSAGITNKPAIPRMERLAASEMAVDSSIIGDIAQLLGVNADSDSNTTLTAIRGKLKSIAGKKDAAPEPVANSESEESAGELLALREENLRLQHHAGLEKVLAPYAARGIIHRANKYAEEDYNEMLQLAEYSPKLCKRYLDFRLEKAPPEGQTKAPDRSATQRMEIVANAEHEFDTTPGHQKATTKKAFVNLRLREANLVPLTEAESKGYALVVG